jgi:hypothetical protein
MRLRAYPVRSALALFALAACSNVGDQNPPDKQVGPAITLAEAGVTRSVAVALAPELVDAASSHKIEVLVRRAGRLVVLDSYASRPGAMSRCRAGQERWVRLIDWPLGRELFAAQVESCLHDIEPADPVVTYRAGDERFAIAMLSGGSMSVAFDGSVAKQ